MVCISKDSLCIWPRGEKTVCFCPVSSEFICQWIYGLEGLPRGRRVKTSREEIWEKHVWFTFVNEWTCLLALFGQIFKNTNISWIQFSFYQYIKCLNLWSTNVKYKKIQFFLSKHYWYSCENTVFFAEFYAVKIFEFKVLIFIRFRIFLVWRWIFHSSWSYLKKELQLPSLYSKCSVLVYGV